MMYKPLTILDVAFPEAKPTQAMAKTISEALATRPESFYPEHDYFLCPFYKDTLIARLYIQNVAPPGLNELWFVTDKTMKLFSKSISNLQTYKDLFQLRLSNETIIYYAAFVSRMFKADDHFLYGPSSLNELRRAGIETDAPITVTNSSDGWLVETYLVKRDDGQIFRTVYHILRDGLVPPHMVHLAPCGETMADVPLYR